MPLIHVGIWMQSQDTGMHWPSGSRWNEGVSTRWWSGCNQATSNLQKQKGYGYILQPFRMLQETVDCRADGYYFTGMNSPTLGWKSCLQNENGLTTTDSSGQSLVMNWALIFSFRQLNQPRRNYGGSGGGARWGQVDTNVLENWNYIFTEYDKICIT